MDLKNIMEKENVKAISCYEVKNFEISDFYLSEEINENTMFSICSISKLLTVIAVLIAKDEKIVDINDDVNKYLKNWELKGGKVLIKDLFLHQSGLVDADSSYGTYDINIGKPKVIELIQGKTKYLKEEICVKENPQTEFIYSDNNTLILEKLLEDIYNMNFREIIKMKILNPLQISNSEYIDFETIDNFNLVKGTDKSGTYIQKEKNIYPYDSVAGLWSTSKDLSTLMIELLKTYNGKSEKILKKETVKEMMSPQGIEGDTGYGVFAYKLRGKDVFYTQGWGEGFQSYMLGFLETGDGIIVIMNQNPAVEQLEGPIGNIVRDFVNKNCQ
jgi:CubicO group peptidase (beta-lactamase class C family)